MGRVRTYWRTERDKKTSFLSLRLSSSLSSSSSSKLCCFFDNLRLISERMGVRIYEVGTEVNGSIWSRPSCSSVEGTLEISFYEESLENIFSDTPDINPPDYSQSQKLRCMPGSLPNHQYVAKIAD